MNEMLNKFSLALCQHLSSLVPGFEGHYVHYRTIYFRPEEPTIKVKHEDWVGCRIRPMGKAVPGIVTAIICPAWTVEDVLRNLRQILEKVNQYRNEWLFPDVPLKFISSNLVGNPDTAYQKIEEYLWTILK